MQVSVSAGGLLTLEIQDDGVGLANAATNGLGLGSMRDRAAEVGGRCTVCVPNGGGTRANICFPLSTGAAT